MYEAYFELREKPFAMTPDPRFLFLSKTHEEALAHLRYGLEQRVGFIAVTGEVGTGKTTLLRVLFNSLDERRFRLALIFNPCLTPVGLMQAINKEFGLRSRLRTLPGLIEEFNHFLLEENHAGRTPVLVIDEAQNLAPEVLEQVRLLSNLETERDKLIQIVLVGQPELDELLRRQELRQLAQRIVVRARLQPLDQEETGAYVESRLRVAGANRQLFDAPALTAVYRHTRGFPRLLNILCDRALLAAFAQGAPMVSTMEVRSASGEIDAGAGRGWRRLFARVAVLRGLFAGGGGYWMLGGFVFVEVLLLIWFMKTGA
jgi:general secretion pathway protein A